MSPEARPWRRGSAVSGSLLRFTAAIHCLQSCDRIRWLTKDLKITLLRPEQGIIARDTLHSVFSVQVNLYHLLPGGKPNAEAKRKYYQRTFMVDSALAKTPEEEEAAAAAAAAAAKSREEQSKTTGNTMSKATRKRQGDEEWQAEGPSSKEGKGRYMLRKRQVNLALSRILEDEAEAEKTMSKTKRATHEPSNEESEVLTSKNGIKTSHRNDGQRNSTGFVIAQQGTTMRILTCAHTIDEVYTAGQHDITLEEVNEFFCFDVHCSHEERRVLKEHNDRPINERERMITQAQAVALDTEKDLLVLEIDTGDIHFGAANITCTHPHPHIDMVGHDLTELEICILQAWPPQRMQSLSVGQLSFQSRTYEALTQINEKGYNMKLSEFTKMKGDEGSSGAPAINGETRCVGVYHGVIGTKGYVVSATDVIEFLNKTGMLTDWSKSKGQ